MGSVSDKRCINVKRSTRVRDRFRALNDRLRIFHEPELITIEPGHADHLTLQSNLYALHIH